jgi:hypothetical protein
MIAMVTKPGAVEAKALPKFDDLQRRFMPCRRVCRIEQADGEEPKFA